MANTYKKEGTKVSFQFSYKSEIVDAIKEIDWKERKWDPIGKEWSVKLSLTNQMKVNQIISKYGFCLENNVSNEVSEESNINTYIKQKSRLNLVKSYKKEIDELNKISSIKPYKFQEEGVDRMCSWPNMIEGDDMGLGKSIQTIYSAEIMSRFPCLLICLSSTKYQWKELWEKVNKERPVSVIESASKENDWEADVVIINYDILGKKEKYEVKGEEKERVLVKHEGLKREWDYIVMDECHKIKNSKSLRSKALKLIAKNVPNIHGLTGTLVENKPVELVNPLMLINVFSQIFGSWNNFTERYCNATDTRFGRDVSGSSNTIELNKLLRETCYIRREKREVLKDLPPIQNSVLNIEIDNKKAYRQAEDEFISYLEGNYSEEIVESAKMAEFLVQRNHLRQLSLKGKIKGIIDWLEDFQEQSTEKVLIVGNFKQPLQDLSIQFDSDLIDGSMSALEKREAIKKWNKGKKQFLFGNVAAIGTGTDGLQDNCSTMVVCDLPDKPSTLDQLIGRLERIGQKNAISIYYLLNKNTIDIKLWEAIELKREITEAVNKGKAFKSVDINSIISKSYLKRK